MAKKNNMECTRKAGAQKTGELETVYNGKALVYRDNTVKVIPNRAQKMVTPVRRGGDYSIDDAGRIGAPPRSRGASSGAVRLNSTMHGSLSKTADGAYLLMMKVYEDEAVDFKTVMKKEIKEALR